MAKRFVDTELWDKEWFMELSCKHKLLIKFIFDKCDASGVWSPNYVLVTAYIGEKVTILDLEYFKNKITLLPGGKVFIPDFIKFQYGKLSKDCKPHIPIYKLLEKHNIDIDSLSMSETIGKTHNVTDLQRRQIFKQDEYICCYCGREKEEWNLVIDHVVSRSKGGSDKPDNLVASCAPCNSKKTNLTLKEFCERHNLDFEYINQRVLQRVSQRVFNTLKDKVKDEDKEKDKVKEVEKEKEKNPVENSITLPFADDPFTEMWKNWKEYKKKEFKFQFKSAQSEQASLNELMNLSNGKQETAIAIILQSMAKGWKGFFELKITTNGQSTTNTSTKQPTGGNVDIRSAFAAIDRMPD